MELGGAGLVAAGGEIGPQDGQQVGLAPAAHSSPSSSRSAKDCTCGSSRSSRIEAAQMDVLAGARAAGRSSPAGVSATASATCWASRSPAGTSSQAVRGSAAATTVRPAPDSVRSRTAKCAASASASWSRARLSSTAVAPSASSATSPGSPNSRSTRSSWAGSPSRTTSGHEGPPVDGQPGGPRPGQQLPGRYDAADQVGEQALRGLLLPGVRGGAAEHAVQDERPRRPGRRAAARSRCRRGSRTA